MTRQNSGGIIIIIILILALISLFYLASNTIQDNRPTATLALSPSGTIPVVNNSYSTPINLTITGSSYNTNTIYQVKVTSSNPQDAYAVYAQNNTPITQFNTGSVNDNLITFYQIKVFGKNTVGVQSPAKFSLNFTLYYNGTIESNQQLIVDVN